MSEPNSLFAKIHITKENFDNFLKASPTTPKLDENWLQWWDSREMHDSAQLEEKNLIAYPESTNEAIIEWWKGDRYSFTFSDYDLENEIWNFGIYMFSENYYEMIPGLAFLKSMAELKTKNEEDFAIVYNFHWIGDDVSAFILYKNIEALIDIKVQSTEDIDPKFIGYANEYLEKKMKQFVEGVEDSD
ncbi:MAG: hypothetical protein Q4F57_04905 [Weeksellaceae bacterium]|nr:hypothetical protein [Weeksellaceae bacterium]